MRFNYSITITLVLLLVIGGCSKKESETIRIGAPLPLTGDYDQDGKDIQRAIELAVHEINDSGGVHGKKLEVLFEDTKGLPAGAASAVSKLIITDKVSAIVGPYSSSESQACLPILNENKVVAISPSSTASSLSVENDYFFRTIVPDTYEGEFLSDFAVNHMKLRKIAILAVTSVGPIGFAESFSKKFKELGATVVAEERGDAGGTDFRAQLGKIRSSKADGLLIAGLAPETGAILKQAKQLGIRIPILSHQPAEDPIVRQIAGNAADGVVFATSKLDAEGGDQATRHFFQSYRTTYGKEPGSYAANAFDAIRILAKLVRTNGLSDDAIRKGLYGLKDFPGAVGKISFNETGDVVLPLRVMKILGGELKAYFTIH